MPPQHLLVYLNDRIHCRKQQIQQLAALLDPALPSPQAVIVHGPHATGKTLTVREVVVNLELPHVIIPSVECITVRHLLERIVLACKASIEQHHSLDAFANITGKCESVTLLVAQLQRLLGGLSKFVLVLDGIDKQREAGPELLPSLLRLGEIIPNLTVLPIVTSARHQQLRTFGIPHIYFPAYNRTETLTILSHNPLEIFSAETVEQMPPLRRAETEEDNSWLWFRFCGTVWDSLGQAVARDVVSLRGVCERLWPSFVEHIRNGSYGTRDFSRLLVRTKVLFQDENALNASLLDAPAGELRKRTLRASQNLSYYPKYLLIAAYLASYNPARTDQTIFSKASEKLKKKRRRKLQQQQQQQSQNPSTPSKSKNQPSNKRRRIQRRLLGPQLFPLERLLAIFHAIVPHDAPRGSADVLTQVAGLTSSRMLLRAGAGTGTAGDDIVGDGARWRVNVGLDYVKSVAASLRFELDDFLAE